MVHKKHIEINIGKACNNKCRFCMHSKQELWDIKLIEFDAIREKLDLYISKDYTSVGFLGGDISIHPKIVDIIAYCKLVGFTEISVISNAMLFGNNDFATRLVHAGLTRMNISIHSHLDEIEDYLTRIPGGLKKKIRAIDNFNKLHMDLLLRAPISINIVLNRYNVSTIVETVLFFYKIKNIRDIRINFIWLDDMMKENWDDMKISYQEFLPYLKRLIYIAIKYNFRLTFDTIPACIFYTIDPKNSQYLINRFLGENLDHITEVDWSNNNTVFDWQEKKKNLLKTKFPQCEKCSYDKQCQGVWKEYREIYSGDEIIPIPDECNNFIVDIDSDRFAVVNKDLVIKRKMYGNIVKAYKNHSYILIYIYDLEEDSKYRHFKKFLAKIIIDIGNNFNVVGILFGKEIDLAWLIDTKCLYNFTYDGSTIGGIMDYKFHNDIGANKLNIYGKFSINIDEDITDTIYLDNIPRNSEILTVLVYKNGIEKYQKVIEYSFGYQPLVNTDQYTFIFNKDTSINGINYRFVKKDINISISNGELKYFFISIEDEEFFLLHNEIRNSIIHSSISVSKVDNFIRKLDLDIGIKVSDFDVFVKGCILSRYYDDFH